jgi:endonuclease/exonuclease/phosphatase family metal-dependent hydrolase
MTEWQKERLLRLVRLLETTAVLLFFYQALRALFSLLFGLIYDALFAGQVPMTIVGGVMAVVVLALLAPLAAPRAAAASRSATARRPAAAPHLAMLAGAVVVFLARIALTFDHLELRLATSILIVAATGFYLAVRLRGDRGHTAYGLILALVIDQLLRTAGHTMDPTLQLAWGPTQVLISAALCLVSVGLAWRQRPEETAPGPRLGLLAGPVWGGWLFLQTTLLAFPNALARWSGADYSPFALTWPFVLVFTLLGSELWQTRRGWIDGLLVQISLLGGLAVGYLLDGAVAFFGLLLACLAAASALFSAFPDPRGQGPDGKGGPGPALALGNLLFFLLHLAYAFTFTYAYTMDLFRDLGLPIFLISALLVGLPLLRLPARAERALCPSIARWFSVCGTGVLVLAWILLVVTPPQLGQKAAAEGSLRAMTYNIHYGYDAGWHLRLEDQAAVIEASGADLVMLQEVDTGRPTSYMVDNAMWLARRLEMTAVYLPTIEHLTGIALLSRYPVIDSRTRLLPSELEQTGIIWALVDADDGQTGGIGEAEGVPVSAFGIWLGLEPEERARQLDAALPFLADPDGSLAEPAGSAAVFGGDFNATPDSPVYARIAAAGFVDPFLALGLDPPQTDPAVNPSKRIDFVWLRDLAPLDAQVPDTTASDHRPVVVEAALP